MKCWLIKSNSSDFFLQGWEAELVKHNIHTSWPSKKPTISYFLRLSHSSPNASLLVVCAVFKKYYHHGQTGGGKPRADAIPGLGINTTLLMNSSVSQNQTCPQDGQYGRETAVLSLMLMLGTLWLGHTLYQFKKRWVIWSSDCWLFRVPSEGIVTSLDLNSATQENQVGAKGRDELGRATWKIFPAEQNVRSGDDALPVFSLASHMSF